jgi:hypothetical protein
MKPYALTTHDGKTVDLLTKVALLAAEAMLGYDLTIVQGSYNAGKVAASAGTHDDGGVIDLTPFDADRKIRVLRRLGFAAWHRTPDQGPWKEHIHAVQVGNARLSAGAKAQVDDYVRGLNGLAGHAADDGPRGYARKAAATTARFEAGLRNAQ